MNNQKSIEGLMAGAGVYQQANGSWIARTGAMNTLSGHGPSAAAATASLERKIAKVLANQAKELDMAGR